MRRLFGPLFLHASLGVLGCGALGLSACGSGGDGSAAAAPDAGTAMGTADAHTDPGRGDAALGSLDFSQPIYPLTVGSTWTYRITDSDGVLGEKTVTATGEELVGGDGPHAADTAVKLVSDRGKELTYSWVHGNGERVVRFREQVLDAATGAVKTETVYDPERLIADVSSERRSAGASWLEVFGERATDLEDGTPTASSETRESWQVLSAAEEVTVPAGTFIAIVLQKSSAAKAKQYWFVPGIGKVKESGGQLEELASYAIAD